MQKIIFIALIAIMSLTLSLPPVLAQDTDVEAETSAVDEAVPTLFSDDVEDTEEPADPEEVTAEELEIGEPGRFSWFGNFVRNVRIAITRDPIKKSDLELKKASEQLLRVKKIVQEKPDDPRLQEKLEKMDGKYKTIIGKINTRIENYKNENLEAPKLKNFLDKYTSQQLKHQEILKIVELKVPEKVMEKIQANRIIHLEKFGEVMNKLQTKEELKERLERAVKVGKEEIMPNIKETIREQADRIERRANRAEILEEMEEKVPILKEHIKEIKRDGLQLFQELKIKREEIQQNREEFRQEAKQEIQNNMNELRRDTGARQNIRQEIQENKQDMTQENQETRQEAREQIRENNPGVGERIMNIFRKKTKLNVTASDGQSKPSIDVR